MPLEVIESQDPLASLILFRASPIYEMMSSLQVLLHPVRHIDWAEEAKAALGKNFMDQLEGVYKPFINGAVFFELAADYSDHQDVLGFINYVRQMEPATFVYYLLGRVFPIQEVQKAGVNVAGITHLVESYRYPEHLWICTPISEWLDDVLGYQSHLTDLWEWYWTEYFGDYSKSLVSFWRDSIQEKQSILARQGALALLEGWGGKKELPPPLPPGYPIREVVFVPLYLISKRAYMFYGYGNVTIMYDGELTEARMAEMEAVKEASLATVRALADESRLKILQIIAQGEGRYNGKTIAAKLGLSASAVSRHLSQLKEGDLITEESTDNRNITYHLKRDTLAKLSSQLLEYIYS